MNPLPSAAQQSTSITATASPRTRLLATFPALQSGNFRKYVAGQAISNIGAWTQRVAQDWLILTLTHNSAAVGVTTALQFLPTILFGMGGGLIADRFPKRRILMTTQSVLALCSLVLALLCLSGRVQLWEIFAVAFVGGTAVAFDSPARQAFVNEMVGPNHLRNAISINSAVFQMGALVGPAISSVLIAVVGVGWSFGANSASFCAAILALGLMRPAELHMTTALARGRGHLRTAVAVIRSRPELLWPIVLAGVVSTFTSNFPVTLTSFTTFFHLSASGYGLLTCSLAVGSLSGALIAARRPAGRLRYVVELASLVAVAQVVAAFSPDVVALCLTMACLGATALPLMIATNSGVQLAAGDHMRGRVMGVYVMCTVGAAAIGGPTIGEIDQIFGPRSGLLIGAVVVAAIASTVGYRLARVAGTAVSPALRSEMARMRAWRPAGR